LTQNGEQARLPDTAAILNSVGEAAYEWRLDTDVLSWSANASDVLGVELGEVTSGRAFALHVEAEPGQNRAEALQGATQIDTGQGVPYLIEYGFKSADKQLWVEDVGRWFAGSDGRPLRAHGVVRRIDERHTREVELTRLAKFDALTGELNRAALTDILGGTLEEAVRERRSCGFLIASIDRLGRLNEAYGVETAETLIAQVAKRLRSRMRGKDHLGRFSGNKFGIVLTSCTPDELSFAAERLIAGVRDEPLVTAEGSVAVTITVGGVTAPRHARTVPEIFARAVDAMHAARARRHGSFSAYQPHYERDARRRANLRATDEIVAALNDRRIGLAFEPVMHAQTWALEFQECLMRVARSDGTLVAAGEMVPVAERLGLVRMLDHRMLELVVAELVADPNLRASVNVSAAATLEGDWAVNLGALVRGNETIAERLIVEITEPAAIDDFEQVRGFVSRVKDLGCRVAMDDFGAGHTSFRNLRNLGLDIVKIDGAFVQTVTSSDEDRAFVQMLIDLSRRLGMQTVAEWVQDEAAAKLLVEMGCNYLQGALFRTASPSEHGAGKRSRLAPALVRAGDPAQM
jgi:diguanylate cyclase (GGDEF)-like protein